MNETFPPTDSVADEELVKAFRSGDEHAFNVLVTRYQDRVFDLCHRILGSYEDTNDCSQETFIRARRTLASFKSDTGFLIWLYHIVAGLCARRLVSRDYRERKAGASPGIPLRPADEEAGDGAAAPSPEDVCLEEKENIVQKVIDSLEDEQKILVVLRDVEGFSYEEISRITGSSLNDVASRAVSARERILEQLQELI